MRPIYYMSIIATLCTATSASAFTVQTIDAPVGMSNFGANTLVLENGNVAVTDPNFEGGRGAVFLYGKTGNLISTFSGQGSNDSVGSRGFIELDSSRFLVLSPGVDTSTQNVGAVTLIDGNVGLNASVSPSNSLLGVFTNDMLGPTLMASLGNGKHVLRLPSASAVAPSGFVSQSGAYLVFQSRQGFSGLLTPQTALFGTASSDSQSDQVTVLSTGDALLQRPFADVDGESDVGCVSLLSKVRTNVGFMTRENSFCGSSAGDLVGLRVEEFPTSIAVSAPGWDLQPGDNRGAVTFLSKSSIVGSPSPTNSVRGRVGARLGLPLVRSGSAAVIVASGWDGNKGAAFAVFPTVGLSMEISEGDVVRGANSEDFQSATVTPLPSGDSILRLPMWGHDDRGAVVFLNQGVGKPGQLVSGANAIIGSAPDDRFGEVAEALDGSRYVVFCPTCNLNGKADVGLVQFGQANNAGTISAGSAVHGRTAGDRIGFQHVILRNGNVVVSSQSWDDDTTGEVDVGALTTIDGQTGIPTNETGVGAGVSSANSLTGFNRAGASGYQSTLFSLGESVVLCAPNYSIGGSERVGLVLRNAEEFVGSVDTRGLTGNFAGDQVGATCFHDQDTNRVIAFHPKLDANFGGVQYRDVGGITVLASDTVTSGAVGVENSRINYTEDAFFGAGISFIGVGSPTIAAQILNVAGPTGTGVLTFLGPLSGSTGLVDQSNSFYERSSHITGVSVDVADNGSLVAVADPAVNKLFLLRFGALFKSGFEN